MWQGLDALCLIKGFLVEEINSVYVECCWLEQEGQGTYYDCPKARDTAKHRFSGVAPPAS